jgi:hypothetical protein
LSLKSVIPKEINEHLQLYLKEPWEVQFIEVRSVWKKNGRVWIMWMRYWRRRLRMKSHSNKRISENELLKYHVKVFTGFAKITAIILVILMKHV